MVFLDILHHVSLCISPGQVLGTSGTTTGFHHSGDKRFFWNSGGAGRPNAVALQRSGTSPLISHSGEKGTRSMLEQRKVKLTRPSLGFGVRVGWTRPSRHGAGCPERERGRNPDPGHPTTANGCACVFGNDWGPYPERVAKAAITEESEQRHRHCKRLCTAPNNCDPEGGQARAPTPARGSQMRHLRSEPAQAGRGDWAAAGESGASARGGASVGWGRGFD